MAEMNYVLPYFIVLGGLALAFGLAFAVAVVAIRIGDTYRFNRWMNGSGNL